MREWPYLPLNGISPLLGTMKSEPPIVAPIELFRERAHTVSVRLRFLLKSSLYHIRLDYRLCLVFQRGDN